MNRIKMAVAVAMLVAGALPVRAQDKVTVPFRDPSMPRKLVVDAMLGSVTVTGYAGQEAIVEMTGGVARPARPARGRGDDIPAGLRRIGPAAGGLDVVEEGNVIRVGGNSWFRRGDLNIQVPQQTSVTVKTMTGREVHITNISGEIEVENANGQVILENVSGSVVAHSMNGKITASLNSVTSGKPMSFSTMNGTIDVTLPADTKANLKMKTQQGEMYTDFDIQLSSSARSPVVEDNRTKGGKYRITTDNTTQGTINGGGPEIQFTSWNGNILIRKKQ